MTAAIYHGPRDAMRVGDVLLWRGVPTAVPDHVAEHLVADPRVSLHEEPDVVPSTDLHDDERPEDLATEPSPDPFDHTPDTESAFGGDQGAS